MSLFRSALKALGLLVEPVQIDLGADYAGDYSRAPAYPAKNSMSAGRMFSWLYASTNRRAAALASLPIRVYREVGGERELLDDHWLYRLIDQPNSYSTGEVFRRDIYGDYGLNGNAFVEVLGPGLPGRVRPLSLVRLHPERVEILTSRSGIAGYAYDTDDRQVIISPDRVLHLRGPSFGDGPSRLFYGVGVVEPLHNELEAEFQAILRAGEAARRGRPDVILSPKSGRTWTPDQRKAVKERYDQLTREGGGAIAASDEAEVKPLSWSPRDMEFGQLREANRRAIIAVTRTPPVALGLETANFATAREQDAQFWQSLLDDARLVDACIYTRLLRLAGEQDTYAEHDVSGVRALQSWRTEATARVTQLYFAGVPLEVALESEGLEDVAAAMRAAKPVPSPKPAEPADEDGAADGAAEEPQEEAVRASGDLDAWWRGYDLPTTEEARAERWKAWVERLHGPTERGLALALSRFLRDQGDRLASRLQELLPAEAAVGTRSFDLQALLASLWQPVAEEAGLCKTLTPGELDAARRAYLDAIQDLALGPIDVSWDPEDAARQVEISLAGRASKMSETTREAVEVLLQRGLNEGQSISEMASAIQQAEAFSPSRALRIARTEATRASNIGSQAAYGTAANAGASVKKQWLCARDSATRDEHWALDGQVVGVGEQFTVPTSGNGHISHPQFVGLTAEGPGSFDTPAMVVNCRCTLIPVVESAAAEETGS